MRYCKYAIISSGDFVPYGMGKVQMPNSVDCDNQKAIDDENFYNIECDENCPYYEEGEADDEEEPQDMNMAFCEMHKQETGCQDCSNRYECKDSLYDSSRDLQI
jgi:hypothetical protein